MNRYQEIVGRANWWLFLVVVALLPFPQAPLRLASVLWIVSWFIEGRWLSRPQALSKNKMAIPFILFGLWYGLQILSYCWSPDVKAWDWLMERYMTFGLLVPVGIWGLNHFYDWRKAGKVLVISCIAVIPIYIVILTALYFHHELVNYFTWSEAWDFNYPTWLEFASVNVSILKHRLFFCSVEFFGIVIASQVYKDKKWLVVLLIAIMLSSLVLTESRQSVLTAAGLMAVGLVCELPRRYRLRYGVGILLFGMIIGGGALKLHPRMQEFDVSDITEMRTISEDHDVRLNIWGVALQKPTDYLFPGLGAGQSTNYMIRYFEKHGMNYYAYKRYHPHNQYLEVLMENGIIGLLLFVLAWLSTCLYSRGRGRITAVLLTTIFCMNMLTDCMFGKFCGIGLWAVGMLLITLQSKESSV